MLKGSYQDNVLCFVEKFGKLDVLKIKTHKYSSTHAMQLLHMCHAIVAYVSDQIMYQCYTKCAAYVEKKIEKLMYTTVLVQADFIKLAWSHMNFTSIGNRKPVIFYHKE